MASVMNQSGYHISKTFLLLCICMCASVIHLRGQSNPFDQKYKLTGEERRQAEMSEARKTANAVARPTPVKEVKEVTPAGTEKEENQLDEIGEQHQNKEDLSPAPSDAEMSSTEQASSTNTLNKDSSTPAGKEQSRQPLFLFLMLVAATILTTLTISSNKSLVNNILRAVLNDNYLNLMYREQKKSGAVHYHILYFVFAVNAGLFLYFLLSRVVFGEGVPLLWRCVLMVGIVYAVRHVFMKYLSYVYPFHKEVEQFAFTILIFNIFLGLILLPINVFVAFSPTPIATFFLYAGLILFAIVYIFRQLRGVFISNRLLFNNKFYFLLYLCAVEIAPVLLLIKYSGAYVS